MFFAVSLPTSMPAAPAPAAPATTGPLSTNATSGLKQSAADIPADESVVATFGGTRPTGVTYDAGGHLQGRDEDSVEPRHAPANPPARDEAAKDSAPPSAGYLASHAPVPVPADANGANGPWAQAVKSQPDPDKIAADKIAQGVAAFSAWA